MRKSCAILLSLVGLFVLNGTSLAAPQPYRMGSLSHMTGAISGAVIKGPFSSSDVSSLHSSGAQRVINYEQAFVLNSAEASVARDNGWLALTCSGEEIHPRNIRDVTLMDARNADAREWRATTIADETNSKVADGTFLDTLRAHFPEDFYDGEPCDGLITTQRDEEWRAASVDMILRVKAKTPDRSYVIANGAGLGTGSGYLKAEPAAYSIVEAADAVHMEHYLQAPERLAEDNSVIQAWNALDADVWAKCDAANDAACTSAFAEVESTRNYLNVVD
jgi:hypothetical protein